MNVYIASSVKDGGIYHYSVGSDGSLNFKDMTYSHCPTYMIIYKSDIYIVLREPFEGSMISGLTKCKLNPNGSMGNIEKIIATQGESGCHLTVDEDTGSVYCANYGSGSLIKLGDKLVTHPKTSHIHQVIFTPDNQYLCATDLGLDAIFMYDADLNFISKASVPNGYGPRHLIFSPCGKYAYCINELVSSVTSFRYDGKKLLTCNTVSSLPKKFEGVSYGSAIRISKDGKYLYASNRGHDSIACFKVNGDDIELFETVQCGGHWPRDFNITPDEKFLYCTNERSDCVTAFSIDSGKLTKLPFTLNLPSPICVIFR